MPSRILALILALISWTKADGNARTGGTQVNGDAPSVTGAAARAAAPQLGTMTKSRRHSGWLADVCAAAYSLAPLYTGRRISLQQKEQEALPPQTDRATRCQSNYL